MNASTGLTGDSADLNLMLEVARMRKTSALANAAKSKVTNLNRSSYSDQLFSDCIIRFCTEAHNLEPPCTA